MVTWGKPIELSKPVDIAEKGIVVLGEFIGFETFINSDGNENRIYEVLLRDGARGVPDCNAGDYCRFWGTKDLEQKLRRIRPRDWVRIEYKGTIELGNDRTMKVFEVRQGAPGDGGGNPPPLDDSDAPPF